MLPEIVLDVKAGWHLNELVGRIKRWATVEERSAAYLSCRSQR